MPAAASATPVVTAARLRLGRLLLQNAFGSDQLDLSMPLLAQYYATVGAFTGFVTNTDDSCTTLVRNNVSLVNYQGSLNDTLMPLTNVSVVAPVAGVGRLVLAKPTNAVASQGNVDVLLHLGDGTTSPLVNSFTCPTATPASPLGTSSLAGSAPIGLSFLATNSCTLTNGLSATYNRNPMGRATFGVYKSPVIFQRENY